MERRRPDDRHIVVAAVALVRDGHVLTVRKRGTERFMLVGGKLEPGESARDAALRETLEEVGRSRSRRPRCSASSSPRRPTSPGTRCTRPCFWVESDAEPVASAEIAEVRWTPLDDHPDDLAPMLEHHVLPVILSTITHRLSVRRLPHVTHDVNSGSYQWNSVRSGPLQPALGTLTVPTPSSRTALVVRALVATALRRAPASRSRTEAQAGDRLDPAPACGDLRSTSPCRSTTRSTSGVGVRGLARAQNQLDRRRRCATSPRTTRPGSTSAARSTSSTRRPRPPSRPTADAGARGRRARRRVRPVLAARLRPHDLPRLRRCHLLRHPLARTARRSSPRPTRSTPTRRRSPRPSARRSTWPGRSCRRGLRALRRQRDHPPAAGVGPHPLERADQTYGMPSWSSPRPTRWATAAAAAGRRTSVRSARVGTADHQPAWIFTRGSGTGGYNMGQVISHEVGHTFGLSHDGTSQAGYYPARRAGRRSWAPPTTSAPPTGRAASTPTPPTPRTTSR